MRARLALIVLTSLLSNPVFPCFAWDGYDHENSADVEIEKGNLVRSGNDIEFYDYGKGEYRQAEVQDINRYGSEVEVEVYDYQSGESRTLTMEDN